MKSLLKLLTAGVLAVAFANVHADPIGGSSCGSCFGTTITLEYNVISPTEYEVHLFVNTSGFVGNGSTPLTDWWITAVAVKPANKLDASSSFVSTTAPGSWAGQLGGLSNGSCDGAGAGFICAQTGQQLALTDGSTYEWIFDAVLGSPGGAWLTADMAASVKVNFDGPNNPNGVLTSEDITLQPGSPLPAPEPGTLALLGIGALALAFSRRRRNG
jgi:hypothetical protein